MTGIKRKLLFILSVSMILLSGCAGSLKDGADALETGNYEEAAEAFGQAVSEEGAAAEDVAAAYRGLGTANYELGKYAEALEAFENAVDNGADQTVQLYNLMGVCAMQTEDYAKGLEYIQAGLTLADSASEEESADAGLVREMEYNEIVCLERQAQWESAKEKIAAYTAKYPDDEAAQKEAEFLQTR